MFSLFNRRKNQKRGEGRSSVYSGNSLSRGMSAEYSQLPDLCKLESPDMRDFGLIYGGLALVLSRCSSRGIERDFLASAAAYRSLQEQFRDGKQITLSAELLNDVRHEVQLIVDSATQNALKRAAERAIAEQRLRASNASRYWDKSEVGSASAAASSISSERLARPRLQAQRA